MAAIRIQHLAMGIALAVISAGCSNWRPPVVIKVVRTVNSAESISSQDYERLREVTEDAIDHIRSVDSSIRPQLTLSTQVNFVDEIADQTQSGFGPDLLITDSDTALELYRRKLTDPIKISPEDRSDTPSYLFDLVTAGDGQLVGRPVNQFVQLACFNKERLEVPPATLRRWNKKAKAPTSAWHCNSKTCFGVPKPLMLEKRWKQLWRSVLPIQIDNPRSPNGFIGSNPRAISRTSVF